MSNTIVLNSSNIVGTDNNTMVYNFPSSVNFKNHKVAVESISINYSWYNISQALNNNSFSYVWWENAWTTFTIVLEDGLYELADINARIQYEMIKNGHYLINDIGQNVYYFEFLVNSTRFAFQLNTFPVPTATQFNSTGGANPTTGTGAYQGWKTPVADTKAGTEAWGVFPLINYNPYLTLSATNDFYKILGFPAGYTSPSNFNLNTNLSVLSTTAPQIQPNTNVFLSMSNIQNPYANPTSIIHNLVVSGAFGATILDKPNEFAYNTLTKGQYNQLRIQFLGADLQPLKINDPDIVVVLLITEQ